MAGMADEITVFLQKKTLNKRLII